MLEAISVKLLIALLASSLLVGQIVRKLELPGPRVLAHCPCCTQLFLTGALFREDAQSFFFPPCRLPKDASEQQRQGRAVHFTRRVPGSPLLPCLTLFGFLHSLPSA